MLSLRIFNVWRRNGLRIGQRTWLPCDAHFVILGRVFSHSFTWELL